MFFSKICCLLFFFILISENCASKMDVLYEWKYVDYLWKNSEQRERAIKSGYRNKSIIIDVDQALGNYLKILCLKKFNFYNVRLHRILRATYSTTKMK